MKTNAKRANIVFTAIIIATIILTFIEAINTYNYEMKKYDIFEGFGAILVVFIGGLIIICELDLFYTTNYFLTKKTKLPESVLNILASFCCLVFIGYIFFGVKLEQVFGDVSFLPLSLVAAGVLRIIYTVVATVREE